MDFMEPLSYPLKDWKKLIIGGLLIFPGMFLLIPVIIANGYAIKVAGDTVRGKDELPEFDDWGYFLMKGLGVIGIGIVYQIGVMIGLILLIIPGIILMFMESVAHVRYGEKENIGAAFEFGEVFRNFKANLGNYIMGLIFLMVLSIVLAIVAIISIITIIGPGIVLFYLILVQRRLFAQIYKESKEKLGEGTSL